MAPAPATASATDASTSAPPSRSIAAVVLFAFMSRTLKGFEIRVSGEAPRAGGFGGFSRPRTVWALLRPLRRDSPGSPGSARRRGRSGQLQPVISPGYGFTAIIVAFLGRLNPVLVLLAGIVLGISYLGGEAAQVELGISDKMAQVFQGMLLFLILACDTLVRYRIRVGSREAAGSTELDRLGGHEGLGGEGDGA